jgi:hypothetical protein
MYFFHWLGMKENFDPEQCWKTNYLYQKRQMLMEQIQSGK